MAPDDRRVLRVRDALINGGIEVDQPSLSHYLFEENGVGYTFDPTLTSIGEIERLLFRLIRSNYFHVVVPGYGDNDCYIGKSTIIEFAWAVRHRRPVVVTNKFVLSERLPLVCRDIVELSSESLTYLPLDEVDHGRLADALEAVSAKQGPKVPTELCSELDSFVGAYLDGLSQ